MGNRFVKGLLCCLVLILTFPGAQGRAAERDDKLLPDGWKFIKSDTGPTGPTDRWESVTIPHTWNTKSADAGDHTLDPDFALHWKSGYYRGVCWYARAVDIPADWKGKRVFLRFEAASLVSKTYLNGRLLGEHRGGFTAFCYELTPYLHFGGTNELRVQVDNSYQEDVPPLSGDFNVDGGIYRPVHLIVTNPVCISPLNDASPGVYLTTKSLSDDEAQVEVKSLVSNGMDATAEVQVKSEIEDAEGKIVASQTQPVSIAAGETVQVVANLTVAAPHRWNGRKAPYLYAATVSILRGDQVADAVEQPLGLRTVAISEDEGFLLNGQPYPIHGVSRHQDWGGKGWAASAEDMDGDVQMILDMGVTAVRLAHYPQSDHWHDRCDHNGLLCWDEIPLVNGLNDTIPFCLNAEQQLREMILQRYNHPSIAFWGLYNELGGARPSELLYLKSEINQLDPARLSVAASDNQSWLIQGFNRPKKAGPVPQVPWIKPMNLIPDHTCFNRYFGWYYGTPDQLTAGINADYEGLGKRVGISEYGGGANPDEHQEGPPKTGTHAEEWQAYLHERLWSQMKDNPKLWGTFLWVMFDFSSAGRKEGAELHINDKGMVTQDRKIKKDAYFFYQANWSDHPMVRITSSRATPRKHAVTEVKVYSNCAKVELSVNGTSLPSVLPDDMKTFRWPNVTLQPGKNEIEATATSDQGTITDSCVWILNNAPPATQPTPAPSAAPPAAP